MQPRLAPAGIDLGLFPKQLRSITGSEHFALSVNYWQLTRSTGVDCLTARSAGLKVSDGESARINLSTSEMSQKLEHQNVAHENYAELMVDRLNLGKYLVH